MISIGRLGGGDYLISDSKRKTGEGGYFTLNRETRAGLFDLNREMGRRRGYLV